MTVHVKGAKSAYRNWSVAESRRKMKLRAVAYKGGKCERCGYSKSYAALDFHHLDKKNKLFVIGGGIYYRWETVRKELDKCIMLCSNCHREEHENMRFARMAELQRRAREEVQPRIDTGIVRSCPQCHRDFRMTPCRLKAIRSPCCSDKCKAEIQERASWPSDELLAKIVWERPVATIATELGVCGGAIKKRCKRRGIPTPPRGYWASLRAKKTCLARTRVKDSRVRKNH